MNTNSVTKDFDVLKDATPRGCNNGGEQSRRAKLLRRGIITLWCEGFPRYLYKSPEKSFWNWLILRVISIISSKLPQDMPLPPSKFEKNLLFAIGIPCDILNGFLAALTIRFSDLSLQYFPLRIFGK
jgi:hypothetical protein